MGILDTLSKNPSFLALAALGVGLFIFRDKISGFFSDITGGAQGTAQVAKTAGILAENFESFLTLTPKADDPIFGESGFFAGIGEFFSNFKLPEFPSFELPSFPSFPEAIPEEGDPAFVGPVQPQEPFMLPPTLPITPPQDFGVTVAPNLLDQIIAPFTGGGVSFEGGTIFETPIENLSLSQIIDQFMVTASQAADIKAQAIGFTPEEQAFLGQGDIGAAPIGIDTPDFGGITGDPQFQGLTPEQIFLQLVGGNISNF